jgi:diguanylate cyclase (GGDEF)-like protein
VTGVGDLEALARRFPPDAPAVTAIWVDVDGLIWFNDSEGHDAGDAALATIARWLVAESAALGLEVYRVAGDEFVLVGRDLAVADATAIADRLVDHSPSLDLRFTGPRFAANDRDRLTVSALVFRADARLALDRRAVCSELAGAIYEAGLAAGRKYQRRGSL